MHFRQFRAIAALACLTIALTSAAQAGGTFAQGADSRATITVKAGSGTSLVWNDIPDGWYLDVEATADHSTVPGNAFAKNTENYMVGGSGYVSTPAIGEGAFAGVDFCSSEWFSNGGELLIGKPGLSGGNDGVWASGASIPACSAFAHGSAEIQNSFTLNSGGPGRPGATAFIDVDGVVNLAAFALSGESATTSFAFSLQLFDLSLPSGSPAVYSVSSSGLLDGSVAPTLEASLNSSSGPLALNYANPYLLTARLDVFANVTTPEPASAVLLALGGLIAWRRR
ncbi:MAG: hypothetical protein U1D55_18930 [Phycisphaerae bacterium]